MLKQETTGQRVYRLRTERGWSQTEFGIRAYLDKTAVSRIEHDRVKPTRRTLRDVARALEVSESDLTGD